jgi:serine/threonine protein kinase
MQQTQSHLHSDLNRKTLIATPQLWIAYQLLEGLAAAHGAGVCHGDLKAENVLVTSWHWAYLADFASYKPVQLPADNPASACRSATLCDGHSTSRSSPPIHLLMLMLSVVC